jgi:SRSO17 transposase
MQSIEELVITVESWIEGLAVLHARLARHFARAEPRQHALIYLKGLLAPLERKNGWHIAEWEGDQTPDRVQRLLNHAKWNEDLVRDDLQRYIKEHLADPQAILIVDETGFPKRGDKSAGVQIQYCGPTGEVENCQVGVFAAYATARGATFLDRELYLSQSWAEDQERRLQAGIPDSIEYTPKTKLARQMIERAKAAGIPFAWVVADALYGDDADLRIWLEEQHLPYVLGVHSNEPVALLTEQGVRMIAAKDCVELVDARADWRRLSMALGTKGERFFDWAALPIAHQGMADQQHWLLIRRSLLDPTDCAFSLVYGPLGTTLPQMVRVAGMRWKIEELFEAVKKEVGLDHYEVRLWRSWRRHITFALLAHAYLTVMRSQAEESDLSVNVEAAFDLLPLTVAEVRRLLWQTTWPQAPPLEFILWWSNWRRRHQARAKCSHIRRRQRKQMAEGVSRFAPPQDQLGRKTTQKQPEQPQGQGKPGTLIQIQYTSDERYVLVGKTEAQSAFEPDMQTLQAVLESVSSFRFSGKNGRFRANKEKIRENGYYWYAHRKHHERVYRYYIGATVKIAPERLEQVAIALEAKIAEDSRRKGKGETAPSLQQAS